MHKKKLKFLNVSEIKQENKNRSREHLSLLSGCSLKLSKAIFLGDVFKAHNGPFYNVALHIGLSSRDLLWIRPVILALTLALFF